VSAGVARPAPSAAPAGAGHARGPLASTFTLGRIAGVEIGINWTWILIFGLIVWSLAGVQFPADAPGRAWPVYAVMGVVAAVVFFASLLAHELGHALQARREGIQIEGITLWLFGGVAKFAGEFPSAGAELRIAAAGPAVSFAIGVAFELAAFAWPSPGAVPSTFAWLGYINLALLAFNLLPALPLDGGRILRAAIWSRTGDLTQATHRSVRIGGVLASGMIFLGIFEVARGAFGGLWLALIGWFVLEAGRSEEQRVMTHDALADVTAGMLMTRAPVTVGPRSTLADVAEMVKGTARHTAYPVVDGTAILGLLPLDVLAQTPSAEWAQRTVAESLTPADLVPSFPAATPAAEAADELARGRAGRALIVEDGALVGILCLSDVARALSFGRPAHNPQRG
jgi:Zn-dependent protease